jgi:beta-galactosidase GanA
LDVFYGELLADAKVESSVPWELPPGVTAALRGEGTELVTFIFNFNDAELEVDIGGQRYSDVLSGESLEGRIRMEAYGFRLLRNRSVN